jgi:transposase-like protein
VEGHKSVLGLWASNNEDANTGGSHRSDSPQHAGTDLHCAPDSRQPGICELEERQSRAADLKLIYRTATAEMGESALEQFRAKYPKHPAVADVGQRNCNASSRPSIFPKSSARLSTPRMRLNRCISHAGLRYQAAVFAVGERI